MNHQHKEETLAAIEDMLEILDRRLKPAVDWLPRQSKTKRELVIVQNALLRLRRKFEDDWKSQEEAKKAIESFIGVQKRMEFEFDEKQDDGAEETLAAIEDMRETLDRRLKPAVDWLPRQSKTKRELVVVQNALLRLRRKFEEDWKSQERIRKAIENFKEVWKRYEFGEKEEDAESETN